MRRVFDVVKQFAGITTLYGMPMAGSAPATQPNRCITKGVRIRRGPEAGGYFDYMDHPRPYVMDREADLAPKKRAWKKLAANLEHDGGRKTDFLLFALQCCDSRKCDVVRGNRFQAMHRAFRLLIKQPDVNVASPEFSCMMVGIFGIANLDDFEVYVDQIERKHGEVYI